MRSFLQRIGSRKFLLALATQVAAVAAVFWPAHEDALQTGAVRIAGLVALVLAALGYGAIEAAVDRAKEPPAPRD